MKLIVAIMDPKDAETVSKQLTRIGYSSSSIDGRGGYLKKTNEMLIVGVDDMRVTDVLKLIGEYSHSREYEVTEAPTDSRYMHPNSVKVGGAVVFVLNVDQFHKL